MTPPAKVSVEHVFCLIGMARGITKLLLGAVDGQGCELVEGCEGIITLLDLADEALDAVVKQ